TRSVRRRNVRLEGAAAVSHRPSVTTSARGKLMQLRLSRLLLAMAMASFVLLAGGCGGSGHADRALRVLVQLTSYRLGRHPRRQTRSYSLRCGSRPSGTLPLAARVCRDISRHPQAMLNPGRARSFCLGGAFRPELRVRANRN